MSRSTRQRTLAAVIAGVVVSVYVAVSVITVLPASPVRSIVVSAASPYFSQKWNVFAPNIKKVNSALSIQAQWRDDSGELTKSEWINVTELELKAVTGSFFPSRIQKSSTNAIGAFMGRYNKLSEAQQERVRDTFIMRNGDGFKPIPVEDLLEELEEVGGSRPASVVYLRYDYMLMRFATTFSTAYFGEDIERVRWRIDRTRANDFEHRFSDDQQFSIPSTEFGWREAHADLDAEILETYRGIVDRYGR